MLTKEKGKGTNTLHIPLNQTTTKSGPRNNNNTKKIDINSFQAIAPLTAHEKGVHSLGEHISLKNRPQRVLLRHDTTPFQDTCFLIKLKVPPDGLYVFNGLPNMPAPTLFRP
jgi:hypothetical protein